MSARKNTGKHILIGGAWPYANGSLHLGHIAALLPGDVLARYFRMTGAHVLYVSGSDCHGTPISVKAASEGVSPAVVAQRYHDEFKQTFEAIGFSYDIYTATMCTFHKEEVRKFFSTLDEKGLLYAKPVKMAFCVHCNRFLPDRYIVGTCYNCGSTAARGDQCDECSLLVDVEKLINMKCTLCGHEPEIRETEHLFLGLSQFQEALEELLERSSSRWRDNAVALTRRYLKEGLKDRAVTRDLDWGIDVPIKGFEDKKIYVWFEAVLGYLTASMEWANERGDTSLWRDFWGPQSTSYFIHGKDNIPFHTLILPSLLMGLDFASLPHYVLSSEYLTIEGKKISTSRNWAVWANDYLAKYDPDPLRYALITNAPEKRDSDFSWHEFLEKNNGELLGDFGNLVNRTLTLVLKGFGPKVPCPGVYTHEDRAIAERCRSVFERVGALVERGEMREALKEIFSVVQDANKYIDKQAPWAALSEDGERAATSLKICLDVILNMASVSFPFLPFTAETALGFLNERPMWEYRELAADHDLHTPTLLVKKLEKSIIADELAGLGAP